jgi:hypothetical protein
MADLFRDTAVGQLLHLLSRGRICPYHDIADDKLANCLSNELTGTETLSQWSTTRNSNFRDLENAAELRQTLSKRSNQNPVPSPDSASISDGQLRPEKLKRGLRLTIVTWDGSRDPAVRVTIPDTPAKYANPTLRILRTGHCSRSASLPLSSAF